ncbi:unnamed protein product [Haemonchus placei]|uniref:G_PROTEIN_RECEP_F1_2 domain-containing protein n=1 Tax=Haemonchus placei TaxID=6290 RepID=A0A0N4WUP0_HAEPC|nr:unnamed protein product [Haemonchus placei]
MHTITISPVYQVVYVIVPTVGTIGNILIIYVTIRSKSLRSTCNILIALISASDIMQMFGLYVMMVTYFATMLVQNYHMAYIAMHVIPAVIITMGFGVWMFIERDEKEYILCEITAPQNGVIYSVITKFVISVNVLIILCYALFLYFMKKATSSARKDLNCDDTFDSNLLQTLPRCQCLTRNPPFWTTFVTFGSFSLVRLTLWKIKVPNNDKMKNIYRSLIVTSLTVVLSWFTGTLVGVLAPVVDHDLTRADADLLAGLFANIPAVANIFIYYFISRDYRLVFQKYLFLCCRKKAGALQVKPGGNLAQKSTATLSTAGK